MRVHYSNLVFVPAFNLRPSFFASWKCSKHIFNFNRAKRWRERDKKSAIVMIKQEISRIQKKLTFISKKYIFNWLFFSIILQAFLFWIIYKDSGCWIYSYMSLFFSFLYSGHWYKNMAIFQFSRNVNVKKICSEQPWI